MLPFKTFSIHYDRLELDDQILVRPDYVPAGDWLLLLDMWRDVSEDFGRSDGGVYTEEEFEGSVKEEVDARDCDWVDAKISALGRLEHIQGLSDDLYEKLYSLIDGIEP